jgi:hypothetical protein
MDVAALTTQLDAFRAEVQDFYPWLSCHSQEYVWLYSWMALWMAPSPKWTAPKPRTLTSFKRRQV